MKTPIENFMSDEVTIISPDHPKATSGRLTTTAGSNRTNETKKQSDINAILGWGQRKFSAS
jgi:hypothetical protein